MSELFSEGEKLAQSMFNNGRNLNETMVQKLIRTELNERQVNFINLQTFFFIATANGSGQCDCSFKGSVPDETGKLSPAIHVTSLRQLRFPDYNGNGLFNSLGNILENPQLGLIFIDFENSVRLRLNGKAKISESTDILWPTANRVITVEIEQVYWNCPKNINKSFEARPKKGTYYGS